MKKSLKAEKKRMKERQETGKAETTIEAGNEGKENDNKKVQKSTCARRQ